MVSYKTPNVPIEGFKRTKIIATIGPATNSLEQVEQLIKSGANGLRLNFSHGTTEEKAQQIAWVRRVSKELGKPVAIIQDLQGPKIRLGDFEGGIEIKKSQNLSFKYKADYADSGLIPTQYDLADKVMAGERLYLFDGKIKTIVMNVKDGIVTAKAENDGILTQRKGINLPDTDFKGDVITKKDKKDLAFGSMNDIDYVAQSFVQSADDVHNIRRLLKNLGSAAKIIAKIETKAALDHLEEIVQAADAVMVARGDLAIETSLESVPIVQRQVIGLGQKYGKPTIVATQMLLSMTDMPEPTRAEVSDVANAVILGADALMLSEETANGNYPIEAVKVMKRVILHTQENAPDKVEFPMYQRKLTGQGAFCDAVIELANKTQAKAMVAETKSGATALQLAARRPQKPIIAVTSIERVAQQLVIGYGMLCYVRPDDKKAAIKLTDWLRHNNVLKAGDIMVTTSGKLPGVVGTTDTIKVIRLE